MLPSPAPCTVRVPQLPKGQVSLFRRERNQRLQTIIKIGFQRVQQPTNTVILFCHPLHPKKQSRKERGGGAATQPNSITSLTEQLPVPHRPRQHEEPGSSLGTALKGVLRSQHCSCQVKTAFPWETQKVPLERARSPRQICILALGWGVFARLRYLRPGTHATMCFCCKCFPSKQE